MLITSLVVLLLCMTLNRIWSWRSNPGARGIVDYTFPANPAAYKMSLLGQAGQKVLPLWLQTIVPVSRCPWPACSTRQLCSSFETILTDLPHQTTIIPDWRRFWPTFPTRQLSVRIVSRRSWPTGPTRQLSFQSRNDPYRPALPDNYRFNLETILTDLPYQTTIVPVSRRS